MKFWHLIIGAFFSVTIVSSAQMTLRMRLLAFTGELELPDSFVQDPAGGDTAVAQPSPIGRFLSRDYVTMTLKSPKLVFTAKSDRASMTREGEVIAEVVVSGHPTTSLLLFIPNAPGSKTKASVLAIDDSKRAFPAGSYYVTNISKFPVKLVLEGKPFDIGSGAALTITDIPVGKLELSDMKAYAFQDNTWGLVAASSWSRPKETRCLVAFYPDPDSGSILFKAFDDVAPHDPTPPVPVP